MRRTISRIFISTILLALVSVSGSPVFGQGAAGLSWNTFLGSAANDQGLAVTVDANGNFYVTGWSLETWGSPVRPFYGDPDFANAFVAKLDRNGALVWNTFLGDIDWAEGSGIAVDANGYLYVVGRSSTWWDAEGDTREDFPGADGTVNVFVAKLDPSGTLLWHTFLGGTGDDYGQGIALDAAGNSYVAGTSYTTWGAPIQAYAGGAEAFAAKLDAAGNLLWSTFLGQTGIDFGRGIGTDASGNAYVTGYSAATWGAPIAPLTFKGGYDAFVAKLDTYGYRQWNVFLGASLYDYGYGIAVDGNGNSYVGGMSWSTWGSPIDAFGGGGRDAFAAKVSANGALLWNTFLGGTQYDYGYAIAIDAGGNSYVTGSSSSSWGTPFRTFTGGDDAFVAKLDAGGHRQWNGFLGGVYEDAGRGVAADASGSAYIAGYSDSTWGAPVRPFDATEGGEEAFAAKIGGGARVDFNSDGQEDILWRYQGEGGFQGLILAWLMDQTEAAAPTTLTASRTEAVPASLLTGATYGSSSQMPRSVDIPRTSFRAPKSSLKYIMLDGKAPALKPDKVMRNPVDAGRGLSAAGRKRVIDKDLTEASTLQGAITVSATDPGTVGLASLSLGTEIFVAMVPDTAWEIAGTGDFDGDGDTDILWRYYGTGAFQGLNDIWLMNGTAFESENIFSSVPDTNWRIAGTGDFNGDGKTDILWRYHGSGTYQGLNVIWHMNGTAFQSETVFSQIADTNWRLVGTGDFNSDGKTDILWRYHGGGAFQGLNVVWYMNGPSILSEEVFSQVTDAYWEIAGTGDFDGDGNLDVLWRYYGAGPYQGMNVLWYMDGTAVLGEEIFSVIPDTGWRIVNR